MANGTAARMALMFLREFLEQLSSGQAQESYKCPMAKCHSVFQAPLQLIQHLLSCQELQNGEFDCDRCHTRHKFPTSEKDWEHWAGWRSQQPLHANHVQRKRSLGSKMREFATLRKKDSRKQNPALDPQSKNHDCLMDSRPSTAASETSSTTYATRTLEHHILFPSQGRAPSLADVVKPMLPPSIPEVNGGMFWPSFNADHLSDLPSTVSSIARSSTFVEKTPSQPLTQNNSQTTLFNPGLTPYQPPTASAPEPSNALSPQPYMFSPQPPFGPAGLTPLSSHQPPSTAMSLDEPLPVTGPTLSPTELRPAAPNGEDGWWSPKVEVETPRANPSSPANDTGFNIQAPMEGLLTRDLSSGMSSPTSPCSAGSPFFKVQPPSSQSLSRALSHDSMQLGDSTVYGTPAADGGRVGPLSPHPHHNDHSLDVHHKAALESTDELRCDECNWKPRGVRENLKGYLRKHKNTHKGLRLACDVPDCTKTFSRLDNLKKHKKDKHGIDEAGGNAPARRTLGDYAERMGQGAEQRRPSAVEAEIHVMTDDYSMLWPALHF